MRIRDAAQHLGVSTRTLRHYEAAGLIRPTRLGIGCRDLSEANILTTEWVRDLIAVGFSTRELRGLLSALDEGQAASARAAVSPRQAADVTRIRVMRAATAPGRTTGAGS